MKKALIVTLYGNHNFGNRLQNYALQKVVESYGFEVTTLDNRNSIAYNIKIRIKHIIKKGLSRLRNKNRTENHPNNDRLNLLVREAVCKFNRDNISHVKRISNSSAFFTDWSTYDLAIAGSDQIWHKWSNDPNELSYYYLQFMPPEKRVAYAASFGFESFPENDIAQHRVGLQGMREISCREESGCRLVEQLTGRRVPRVLDPTLLLSASEWREIAKQSNNIAEKQEKYAFAFFLGNISEEYRKYIETTMKEKGIDQLIDFNDNQIGACGPFEFLNLIDNAQFVFTDSFHCTVFSTIFEKDFTAFRRVQPGFEKMFGRIEDLLSSTNKLDHIYGGTQQTPKNDFDELRQRSIQYFETILGITNEN